jgi:hypothetical protein
MSGDDAERAVPPGDALRCPDEGGWKRGRERDALADV